MSEWEQWVAAAVLGVVLVVLYGIRAWRKHVKEIEKDSHWLHD